MRYAAQEVDAPSTWYAGFGCILFECLSGKKAFEGPDKAETLASVLTGEPEWQDLPPMTPGKVTDLLHRCLHRDPRERLRDIGDARIEMREACIQPLEPAIRSGRFSRRGEVAMVAVGLFAGILISSGLMRYLLRAPALSVVRSVVKVEPGHWFAGSQSARTGLAISGDGRFVVYSAIPENTTPQVKPQLYLRLPC